MMAKRKDYVTGILLALVILVCFLARFGLYNEHDWKVYFGSHAISWSDFRFFAVITCFALSIVLLVGKPMRYMYLLIGLFIGFIMIYELPLYGVGGEHLFNFYWSGK